MPKLQSIHRTAGGLQTNPNAIHEAGEGACLELQNCVIDRPGVISKRRGFVRFGPALTADSFFEFTDRILAHSGSTLSYDSDGVGTWTAYKGSHSAADSTHRMRGIQYQGAAYFTSSVGIKRTDSLTSEPIPTGISTGLDKSLSLTGTGGGFFAVKTQVGYRIVWGRVDRNDRLLVGAPSFREVISNPLLGTGLSWTNSGATVTVTHTAHGFINGDVIWIENSGDANIPNGNYTISNVSANAFDFTAPATPAGPGTLDDGKEYTVQIDFTVPDDVEKDDFYEIYRTDLSASLSADPGDTQKRVIRNGITVTSITWTHSGGTVTVTHTAHGFATGDIIKIFDASDTAVEGRFSITNTGANTYTYTVGGAPAASGTANDLKMRIAIIDDWDFSLGEALYTNIRQEGILQANARPPWAKDITQFKGYMFYANTKKEHSIELQLREVTGLVDDTSAITIVQGATSETYTFSTAENLGTQKFRRFTSEPTEAQNVEKTIKSLCSIINRDPQSIWYAYYVSGILDPPGSFVIESRTLNTVSFSVTANNATTGSKFLPIVPTSGTLLRSFDQQTANRLYRSKFEEPESVPDLNYDEVGDISKEIIRILPLRDSLIILTEGGVYRLSGETDRTFTLRQLDPSVHVRCPDAAVVLSNAVFCFTTGGIMRITESGTSLISFPVDDIFERVQKVANYQTIVHAVAYESESRYILWCPEKSTDTVANVAWVYNGLTRRWSGPWRKQAKAAYVLFETNDLFLANDLDGYVIKERKDYTIDDYIDEEIDATVNTVTTTTDSSGNTVSQVSVTWNHPEPLAAGFAFRKEPAIQEFTTIETVEQNTATTFTLTLGGHFPGLAPGSARIGLAIRQRIRWAPEEAENAGIMKHFSSAQVYLEDPNARHHRIGFYSDMDNLETILDQQMTASSGEDAIVIRAIVPQNFQRCRALNLIYENRYALEAAEILQVSYSFRAFGDRTMVRSS